MVTRSFAVRDFDALDVLSARFDSAAIGDFIAATKSAHAIVLSTPVYKATYSGALKVLVDLVPPDALVGKVALGIATTKLAAHGVEVSTAYAALFRFFRTRTSATLALVDDDFTAEGTSYVLSERAREQVVSAADVLVASLG